MIATDAPIHAVVWDFGGVLITPITQLLDEIKTSTDTLSASTNDSMDVHVYGPSLATVVGTSTEKGKDKHGKQFSRSFGWVDTWMERNGKWECIGEAVMPLHKKK